MYTLVGHAGHLTAAAKATLASPVSVYGFVVVVVVVITYYTYIYAKMRCDGGKWWYSKSEVNRKSKMVCLGWFYLIQLIRHIQPVSQSPFL